MACIYDWRDSRMIWIIPMPLLIMCCEIQPLHILKLVGPGVLFPRHTSSSHGMSCVPTPHSRGRSGTYDSKSGFASSKCMQHNLRRMRPGIVFPVVLTMVRASPDHMQLPHTLAAHVKCKRLYYSSGSDLSPPSLRLRFGSLPPFLQCFFPHKASAL
jgi:hypothetical protein